MKPNLPDILALPEPEFKRKFRECFGAKIERDGKEWSYSYNGWFHNAKSKKAAELLCGKKPITRNEFSRALDKLPENLYPQFDATANVKQIVIYDNDTSEDLLRIEYEGSRTTALIRAVAAVTIYIRQKEQEEKNND